MPRCDPATAFRVPLPATLPHHILVLNKSDLGAHPGWAGCHAARISCTSRAGVDELVRAIQGEVTTSAAAIDSTPLAINARHQQCLRAADGALAAAHALLAAGEAPEFTAEELRAALHAIGDIIGRVDAEEVLGAIFGRFCIGK